MYKVLLTKAALRDLDSRLPRKVKSALAASIEKLSENPYPVGVKKLQGIENLRRIDVGDFRILYAVHDHNRTVIIEKVGDRKEVYRFLKR